MRALPLTLMLASFAQICLSVEPGDPFPTRRSYPKTLASVLFLNSIGPNDPHDDLPLLSTDSTEKRKESMENITTSLRKITVTIEREETPNEQNLPLVSTIIPVSSISRNNLIKINRWKFQTLHTNEVRYWYEPDGGNMGKGWNFDAVAFLAYSKREPGTKPVYSFHSEMAGEWSNTLQLDSTPPMVGTEQWISDGISFYTYPTPTNSHELQPVWRYWNAVKNTTSHKRLTFLVIDKTDSEQERIGWIRDQVLFHALPYEA